MEEISRDDKRLLIEENVSISSTTTSPKSSKTYKGLIMIISIVLIWIISSFVISSVESKNINSFALTTLSTTSFLILLPVNYIQSNSLNIDSKIIKITLGLLPLWFLANYSYNLSLCQTSITSSTILSSTSSIFTLLLGYLFKTEKITLTKILGVSLCFIGICLTTFNSTTKEDNDIDHSYSDSSCSNQDTLNGDSYALCSSFLYACYSIYLKKSLSSSSTENDNNEQIYLIFGLLGLFTLILCLPFVLVFDSLKNNLNQPIILLIFINALFNNVISDLLWTKAILLTTPVMVTIGISLTIPFTAILDNYLNSVDISIWLISGALLMMIALYFVIER